MYKIAKEFVEYIVISIITGRYKLNNTQHLNEDLTVFILKTHLYKYIMNVTRILIIKHNPLTLIKKYEYDTDNDFVYLSNAFPIIKFMDLESQIDLDREYNKLSIEFGKECLILPEKLQKKIEKKCKYVNIKNMSIAITDYLQYRNIRINKKDVKLLASVFLYSVD